MQTITVPRRLLPWRVWYAFGRRMAQARGRRAEERQRAYQIAKARQWLGQSESLIRSFSAYAKSVRDRIECVQSIEEHARVLEVGSGAHGLIFFLGLPNVVGVDPLADIYPSLFPEWQNRAKTIRAYGEALPFEDASFDIVLSDNVIDHAERPAAILSEIVRVLRPGGTLYFTVHVHHPIYAVASSLHGVSSAIGSPYEVAAFADHTVHFTLRRVRAIIRELPLRVLREDTGVAAAKAAARTAVPRHAGDRLKRLFFKNARFEILAVRK